LVPERVIVGESVREYNTVAVPDTVTVTLEDCETVVVADFVTVALNEVDGEVDTLALAHTAPFGSTVPNRRLEVGVIKILGVMVLVIDCGGESEGGRVIVGE